MTTRNSNAHFAQMPQIAIERSTFNRDVNIKTTFDVSELVPFYIDEVLPGDTFDIETSKVVRLQTLLEPVMDNLYLDTYYFFVPNRLVWEHWKQFMGENTESAWVPQVEYSVPYVIPPENGWQVGTIADYMGLPVNRDYTDTEDEFGISALPFRAYALIVNEWFRDQNLQDPCVIPRGDSVTIGSNGDNYITDLVKGGKPFVAAKYHDYFTSALPQPQRGEAVNFIDGMVPIRTNGTNVINPTSQEPVNQMKWLSTVGGNPAQGYVFASGTQTVTRTNLRVDIEGETEEVNASSGSYIVPSNLVADLSNGVIGDATQFTINSLRTAFQIQRLLERDMAGTRYIELLKAHFGVTSPDARLQRPEYLGGNRVPFNIEQVLQTNGDESSPLGSTAGWSQTNDYSDDVHKSFVEHGYIIGLMCARYDHSYQQGIERFWSRQTKYDFYWPALAHLGNQAILNKEIYVSRTNEDNLDDEVFGYQEAWAEYRYKPNYITGLMRSEEQLSLDVWHFGDYYEERPYLSADWIKEDKNNVMRTLAVQSSAVDEKPYMAIADIFVKCRCTRPLPLYSIPGLVDHF